MTLLATLMFLIFFLLDYATNVFFKSNRIEDRVVLIHLGIFYYFLKENACKMIWWRPNINIHIPTTWM